MELSTVFAIALVVSLSGFAITSMVRAYQKPILDIPFPDAVIDEPSLPLSQLAQTSFISAVSTYKAGDYRGAIDHCKTTLKQEPNCAEAFHNMGLAYANIGDNDKALRSFLKAGDAYDKQETKAVIERIKQDLEPLKAAG